MKNELEQIVKALVDNPEAAHVRAIVGDKTTVYEVTVVKEDRGKVIGKGGAIIKALRTIVHSNAAKTGRRAALEIVE